MSSTLSLCYGFQQASCEECPGQNSTGPGMLPSVTTLADGMGIWDLHSYILSTAHLHLSSLCLGETQNRFTPRQQLGATKVQWLTQTTSCLSDTRLSTKQRYRLWVISKLSILSWNPVRRTCGGGIYNSAPVTTNGSDFAAPSEERAIM